jgi:hypothetical protein
MNCSQLQQIQGVMHVASTAICKNTNLEIIENVNTVFIDDQTLNHSYFENCMV